MSAYTTKMLKKICRLKVLLKAVMALIDNGNLPSMTSEDWNIWTELVKILKPFAELTNKVIG